MTSQEGKKVFWLLSKKSSKTVFSRESKQEISSSLLGCGMLKARALILLASLLAKRRRQASLLQKN